MLEAIRKRSASILVKILFALLILSFAAWGIDDMIRGVGRGGSVATVGGRAIAAQAVVAELERELRRFSASMGTALTREQARAMGLPRLVLGRMIDRALISLAAEEMGLATSDDAVRRMIRELPAFRNQGGQFDRTVFQQLLFQAGFSEEQYVFMARGDLTRGQVLDTVNAAGYAPKAMVETLFRHRHERRAAEVLRFADDAAPDPGQPDQAALEKFHQDHAPEFTAPAYRAVTAVALSAGELAKELAVADEDLQEAYESRRDEFNVPEKRAFQQIVVPDQATADKAYNMLTKGRDFAMVAKEVAGFDADTTELGTFTRDALEAQLPEMAEAAFSLADGGVTSPGQSAFGWHVLKLKEIQPARIKTLEEARPELTQAIAQEKAIDGLFDLANRLEDTLGGGATLEEAAATLNARLVKVDAVDAQGKDRAGRAVEDLPGGSVFVDAAFSTDENQESPLTETGTDGYFILRVDAVTPAQLRPLDTVRDMVVQAWRDEQRQQWADKAAETALERLTAGIPAATVAQEIGGELTTADAFGRDGEGAPADLADTVVQRVFDAEADATISARGRDASFVAKVLRIEAPDPVQDPEAMVKILDATTKSLRNDFVIQYAQALRTRYEVTVNNQVLEQLF